MTAFNQLAIAHAADLRFGVSPKPLTTRRGLTLGGGLVHPELNFTLPTILVNAETMPEVRQHYQQIIAGALQRAVELEAPGLVIEFETLPPMTENPAWGNRTHAHSARRHGGSAFQAWPQKRPAHHPERHPRDGTVRYGSRLTPSSFHSGFTSTPAVASAAGRRSSWMMGRSSTLPAGHLPCQEMMNGTRMPP